MGSLCRIEPLTAALTPAEATERKRRERLFRRYHKAVSRAANKAAEQLAYIRDHRLYRDRWGTFEAYCTEHLGINRATGYRYLEHASTWKVLTAAAGRPTSPMPTAERQTRPLRGLPDATRREAWSEAVELAGGRAPTGNQGPGATTS